MQTQPADEAVASAADASAAGGADGVAACGAAEPAPTWPKNFAQFHFSELALAAGDLNVRLRPLCFDTRFLSVRLGCACVGSGRACLACCCAQS